MSYLDNLLSGRLFRGLVGTAVLAAATPLAAPAQGTGFWHTSGAQILDNNNQPVRIAGINWYGFETSRAVPGGLTSKDYKAILQTVKSNGYNTVRIPLSNQMVETPTFPTISYNNASGPINTDLQGENSLQILDSIVTEAGTLGLKIILDNHRSEAGDSAEGSGLWYTGAYPESAWINDWTTLANRYANNPTVVGFDLRNEPHNAYSGGACWDCGGSNDWHLAAERAGNAVLAVNPRLLIFVEGVDAYNNDYYWWGGNLEGVSKSPVNLSVPGQIVYSAHDYGPTEYGQSWFNASTTASSLNSVWTTHWGYIAQNGMAPVWLGEFGTTNDAAAAGSSTPGSEGQWFQSLVGYLAANPNLSWTYWALDGEDRYGLLDSIYDPTPVSPGKQSALSSIQFSLNPGGASPATPPSAPSGLTATAVSASQINLAWAPSPTSGVTYSVYSGGTSGGTSNLLTSGLTATSFSATALSSSTAYFFTVKAVSNAGDASLSSNQASATTQSAGSTGAGCHVTYVDANDWGSGFTGSISITNNGAAALSAWTLTWSYSGNQQISQSWNSNETQSGKSVTLTNAGWNGNIGGGATLSGIGFNAIYSGTNASPTQFYLNGTLCH